MSFDVIMDEDIVIINKGKTSVNEILEKLLHLLGKKVLVVL